jgi:hypothetical protein
VRPSMCPHTRRVRVHSVRQPLRRCSTARGW